MKASTFNSALVPVDPSDPEYILTRWLFSIVDFHKYYYQLVTCFNQSRVEQDLKLENIVYLGQCPINLLVDLIITMKQELKNLDQDIDQLTRRRPLSITKNYQKLRTHTRILNQLNQQAQHQLYLVTLSSS